MASVAFLTRLRNTLLVNILGFGAGAAAATVFEPAMRPLAHEFEERFKSQVLTPAELAALQQRDIRTEEDAAEEAGKSGLTSERFHELTLLAGEPPAPTDLIQLLRRGSITEADYMRGFIQGRVRKEWAGSYLNLKRAMVTPDVAAGLAARELIDESEAHRVGEWHGIIPQDIDNMIRGELRPPPLGEILELVNRKELGESAIREALTRGGIESKYHNALGQLRFRQPPPTDLIRFAVREVFTPSVRSRFGLDTDFPAEFARLAELQGIPREQAEWYWAAHWDLPSPEMGFRMYQRRIIPKADLELLLRSLDVMPFWRDKLIQLAYLVPGRIDLRRMFAAGVINEERVYNGYLDIGYDPENAQLLTEFATAESLTEEKSLAKSEITQLYQARAIDESEARDLLSGIGYNDDAINLILRLSDVRRLRAFRNAVVSIVRQRYLDREIDVAEATTRLDTVGIGVPEREDLLDLWTFAREENPRRLTEAQARSAWRRGFRDVDWYKGYLALLGYPPEEVDVLVQINTPATEGT